MGWQRPREPRRTVFVRARLRGDCGWSDTTICNVSSRGLMLKCAEAPGRGAYIEVRYRSVCIVGRVAWSQGPRCGVRTQDQVDIEALLSQGSVKPSTAGAERRTAPRPQTAAAHRRDTAAREEASHRFARAFDWSMLALAVAAAASVLTGTASAALDRPMQKARAAMERSAER